MALSQEDIETIVTLWKYNEQQADPRSQEKDIVSGLRARPLIACQYWIKGLGTVCDYWDGEAGKCTYEIKSKDYPSGYNNGYCDFLGRRDTCDKYTGITDTENYACIAPNIFLSGLGKVAGKSSTGYTYAPIPINEIKGYCDGQCDGQGRGTGCDGTPGESPIICNYYRPWQMGFGSVEPRQVKDAIINIALDGTITLDPAQYQRLLNDVFDPMGRRLPFAFEIYNLRAQFQKCAYWNNDYGSYFNIGSTGYVSSDEDLESLCSCPSEASRPYCTLKNPTGGGTQEWLMQDVWSEANTVICNGAKPECPCYTGEWVYCDDLHMVTGMRITANQIFELRFWASAWASQEEYDAFYEEKPNWQDTPTASIYTFKEWKKLGSTVSDSIMKGRILSMCMPVPLNSRRFVPVNLISDEPILFGAKGQVNADSGTTAPGDGQIYFPSLIRHPDVTSDIQYIDIIYPYANFDPWNQEVCGGSQQEAKGIKRGVSIDGDTISVIGSTIRNRTVYAFNLSMVINRMTEWFEHWNISKISNQRAASLDGFSPREKFFERLEDFIDNLYKVNPNNIHSTVSDQYGYFKVGPLNLKYGEENRIIICVKFGDTSWDFRVRPVESMWYGGLLLQNSFEHEGTGYGLPTAFAPNANIESEIIVYPENARSLSDSNSNFECSLRSIMHSFSVKYKNHLLEEHSVWTYSYRKVKLTETVINWTRIGNGGHIWAELADTNINSIFEWGIESAVMSRTSTGEEGEGESATAPISCLEEGSGQVDMEEVEIEEFVSGKVSVSPSACVLKPKDGNPRIFFNDEWNLIIEYWYKEISDTDTESTNIEIVHPDFSNEFTHFVESNLDIEINQNNITIRNVYNQTIALTAIFEDEEGRIVTVFPTKMLTQVNKVECRSEEIFYRYEGPSKQHKLSPDTGGTRFREKGTIELDGDGPVHYYTPPCGDHENGSQGNKDGPMWYPYNSCADCDFYKAWGVAAYCTAWFRCAGGDNPETNLVRYCGPPLKKAWALPAPSLAFCHTGFKYRYSDMSAGNVIFTGYANIVPWVDVNEYAANRWSLPPFGNRGREFVVKYLSQDYHYHVSVKGGRRSTASDWVPVVPNINDFSIPIGYFDEESFISNSGFEHTNQLNFLRSILIGENVVDFRRRFEDVLGVRGIWRATYPKLVEQGVLTHAAHYYFKESDIAWVWRERWKDIEYLSTRELYFANYERPDYVYDDETMEHRFICSEDSYTIQYTAPEFSSDGELDKYPSIRLGNGPKRYFNIIYDDYDSNSNCVWMDEGSGVVDGSTSDLTSDGEKEENIYEKTSPNTAGSKWIHDENCIFEEGAVDNYEEAETAGRVIQTYDVFGESSKTYWNRGIIVDIDISSLKYLPYEEGDVESFASEFTPGPDENGMWTVSFETNTVSVPKTMCISKIIVSGYWGLRKGFDDAYNVTKTSVCIPQISVVGNGVTIAQKDAINYDEEVYGDIGLKQHTIEILIQPTVERMLSGEEVKISFDPFHGQRVIIDDVAAVYCQYADTEEVIQVYERLYVASKGSEFGDWNINGPKVNGNFVLQGDLDGYNSGTYYAISPQLHYVPSEEFETRDKMRAGYASEQYSERESLNISIGNIAEVEAKQGEYYTDAYNRDVDGDVLTYKSVVPYAIAQFLEEHDIDFSILGRTLTIRSKKPTWDNHYLSSSLKEGAVWNPGGHYWQWSSSIESGRCWEYVYGSPAWVLKRYDLQTAEYIHVDTGVGVFADNIVVALFANRLGYKLECAEKLGLLEGMDVGNLTGTATETFIDPDNVPTP